MLTIKYETTFKKDFKRVLRQHRTKTALRLSTTALHKFRQPISVRLWLRFLGRHLICLHIFRHLAQKFLDIRQYAFEISVQSDEKSDSASAALSLCGIALMILQNRFAFCFGGQSGFVDLQRRGSDILGFFGSLRGNLLSQKQTNLCKGEMI